MRLKTACCIMLAVLLLAACGGDSSGFDGSISITVVSREDGSGTRGAFVELFGLEQQAADGSSLDTTTLEAVTTNNSAVMMNTVSSNRYAIGYLSLGSLNDSVKALKIDGRSATAENILNGSYPIARPFLIATKAGLQGVSRDFVDFILSAEGQAIVSASGYIPLEGLSAYNGTKPAGKVTVAGSSSVTPVMEKLKEAYLVLNPSADIEIQQSDSSTGMSAVLEGICDIGMASRQLKESETGQGLVPTFIAMDGIAVIVSPQNPVDSLTTQQVRSIFSGKATTWDQVM